MALTERLAYILSVDASGAVGFDKGAVSAERLAVAEAKAELAAAKLEAAEIKAAKAAASAANDDAALTAAKERGAAASSKLAAAQASVSVATAKLGISKAEKDLQSLNTTGSATTGVLGRVAGTLGGLGKSGGLLSGLGGSGAAELGPVAGVAAAGAAVAKFAEEGVQQYASLTEAARNFQNVSGAGAEDSSRMAVAFRELGVDTDAAGKGLFKLARNVDDSHQALQKLGVQVDHNRDGSVDLTKTFLNVADAVAQVGPGVRADEIAFAAFGRQGATLLPILLQGRDGLQQFFDAADQHGEVFSQQDIERGRQFQIAIQDLKESWTGLEAAAGRELIPLVTLVTKATTTMLDFASKAKGLGPTLAAGIALIPGIGPPAAAALLLADHAMGSLKTTATDTAPPIENVAEKLKSMTDALDTALSAVNSYNNSLREIDRAKKAVADASGAQARKEADIAKANQDSQRATEDLKSAEDRLSDARRNVPIDLAKAREEEAAATHSVATSEDDLRVAIAKYGDQSHQAADAQDKLAEARLRASDATDKANQLEQAGDRPQSVVDAERAVADAKQRQADAAERKKKADAEDPIAEQQAAEEQLAQAEQNRDSALQKIKDDIDKVNEALGTQFTWQDAIDGKLKGQLDKIEKIKDDAAAAAASVAGIIAGIPQASQGVATIVGGAGKPAPPPATGSGAVGAIVQGQPTSQTTNNYTFNIQSIDPAGAANEINWTIRSGGLN